jgi:hypothetical protein
MISPKHQEFIRLVANGANQKEAYRVSIGKSGVSDSTCEGKSSNLAKKYAKEIDAERKRIQDIVTSTKDSEVIKTALNGILSQAEVDKALCDSIINPENGSEKLKAIDLYNKRFGSNAPIQTQTDLTLNGAGDLPIDKWLKDAESK